jgi:hypothetical protein
MLYFVIGANEVNVREDRRKTLVRYRWIVMSVGKILLWGTPREKARAMVCPAGIDTLSLRPYVVFGRWNFVQTTRMHLGHHSDQTTRTCSRANERALR